MDDWFSLKLPHRLLILCRWLAGTDPLLGDNAAAAEVLVVPGNGRSVPEEDSTGSSPSSQGSVSADCLVSDALKTRANRLQRVNILIPVQGQN